MSSAADDTLLDDLAGLETADIFFAPVPRRRLADIGQEGLSLDGLKRFDLLPRAQRAAGQDERVLVIRGNRNAATFAAPDAILNVAPFREPKQILAGGGVLIREGDTEPHVLLIFRRGVWDLPKGKPEPGEQIEQCALREVREEIGVRLLALLGPAGATLHGYPQGDRYLVKRTTWLFLSTPERSFTPAREEEIERAEWFPWPEAEEQLGYENLRRHLRRLGAEAAKEVLGATE